MRACAAAVASSGPCQHLAIPPATQALQWVAGLADRPANLVNLSDQHNERVCFIAGHTAVCYDKRTRKQTLLQVRSTLTPGSSRSGSVLC